MSVAMRLQPTVELSLGAVHRLTVKGVPLKLTITGLTLWNATFTVTGPGVRNPERPRTMPLMALACWLELARKEEQNA